VLHASVEDVECRHKNAPEYQGPDARSDHPEVRRYDQSETGYERQRRDPRVVPPRAVPNGDAAGHNGNPQDRELDRGVCKEPKPSS
jgi:hypothetical protein